jgi:ribonuclease-3
VKAKNLLSIFFFRRNFSPRQQRLLEYLRSNWGIAPRDITWYEKALRHKSVVGSGKYDHADCNERLELLGDSVLDTVITEYLFKKYPENNEGELTKIRARIVNRQTLGTVGKASGLHEVIEARIGNEDSMDKIVGNALEAWLGAIYIDQGFESAKRSIDQYLIPRYINMEQIIDQAFDFKSKLIEWTQQRKLTLNFDTSNTPNDENLFVCSIIVNQELIARGKERSKKKAEQIAAHEACIKLTV